MPPKIPDNILRHPQPISSDKQYAYTVGRLNGKKVRVYMHYYIAIQFIPNPLNKPYVRHKNGNTLDNTRENLEWSDTL